VTEVLDAVGLYALIVACLGDDLMGS